MNAQSSGTLAISSEHTAEITGLQPPDSHEPKGYQPTPKATAREQAGFIIADLMGLLTCLLSGVIAAQFIPLWIALPVALVPVVWTTFNGGSELLEYLADWVITPRLPGATIDERKHALTVLDVAYQLRHGSLPDSDNLQ